ATRLERAAGGILLATVCYGGFKIEHLYGHHVHVSTPLDASSARRGQSVYAFVPQAVSRNLRNAWRLEAERLRRRGLPAWRNEVLHWSLLSLACAGAAWIAFGPAGLLFFLAQSAVAFCELEIINYVEHYGLARRKTEHGYERVAPVHSWNSSYRLANWFLLNLARHSDHHAFAARRYQELRHVDDAPQLPGGYGAMVLLALLPPLWFRVIDPRIPPSVRQTQDD
ncbi:MAG TPA: alkane 1-monooxygenase, partial [Paucimonas sp.]|nr:alkane 1-monooxygenase [Paucimonas sp.]